MVIDHSTLADAIVAHTATLDECGSAESTCEHFGVDPEPFMTLAVNTYHSDGIHPDAVVSLITFGITLARIAHTMSEIENLPTTEE